MGELLGQALKSARKLRKMSQEEVAAQVGVSRAAVGQWEAGDTEPSTSNLLTVCSILNIDVAAATGGQVKTTAIDGAGALPAAVVTDRRPAMRDAEQEFIRHLDADPRARDFPLDVPVYGVAVGGTDADFFMNGEIVDFVRRPPGAAKTKNIYAIYIVGTSMVPKFEEGELAYVSPARTPSIGDYVVVECHPEDGGKVGRGFVKKLVRRTATKIVCEQFNPPRQVDFPVKSVKSVHRIIPWSELLGI